MKQKQRDGISIRKIGRTPAALLVLLPLSAAAGAQSEVERTWEQGTLAWAQDGHVETGAPAASLDAVAKALAGRKAPAVVYLHGCSGLDAAASSTAAFLAGAGYLVASPDSFARTTKPASCDATKSASDLHRGVLGWRQAEAAFAVERLRGLPFVDGGRVYLYGFSEGGAAVATLAQIPVRARVVEGWSCHSGWPEYAGLNAPPGQPVLALTSAAAPGATRGDCSDYMKRRFGSRSVVFRPPDPLSNLHHVSGSGDVQKIILDFLRSR